MILRKGTVLTVAVILGLLIAGLAGVGWKDQMWVDYSTGRERRIVKIFGMIIHTEENDPLHDLIPRGNFGKHSDWHIALENDITGGGSPYFQGARAMSAFRELGEASSVLAKETHTWYANEIFKCVAKKDWGELSQLIMWMNNEENLAVGITHEK